MLHKFPKWFFSCTKIGTQFLSLSEKNQENSFELEIKKQTRVEGHLVCFSLFTLKEEGNKSFNFRYNLRRIENAGK
jgi:hypothetical protein